MEAGFVQAGAVRLQCFVHGTGSETIVFVHGYEASGRIWRMVQAALDPTRYRTIALSNRGAGDSDRSPREEDYFIESFAADLYAAVQAEGLRDFTLVGHSMGGATVTSYALDHQDTLKALVLLNSASLDAQSRILHPLTPEQRQALDAIDRSRAPKEFLDALLADMARNPPERLSGGRKSMGRLHLRERLGELHVPVLVVGGDRDDLVGVDNILREYLALPRAYRSLQIFHGVAHAPNIGVPNELAGVLDRFVSSVSVRRAFVPKT
jgi:branched-chain amino acid transport system permease protein